MIAFHRQYVKAMQRRKRVLLAEPSTWEVGYLLAGIKSLSGLAIGDTLTEAERHAAGLEARRQVLEATREREMFQATALAAHLAAFDPPGKDQHAITMSLDGSLGTPVMGAPGCVGPC